MGTAGELISRCSSWQDSQKIACPHGRPNLLAGTNSPVEFSHDLHPPWNADGTNLGVATGLMTRDSRESERLLARLSVSSPSL